MGSRVMQVFTCCRRSNSPSGGENSEGDDSERTSSCHADLLELIDICIDPSRSLLNNDVLVKTCNKWRHEELKLKTSPEVSTNPAADDTSPSVTGQRRRISAEGVRRALALDNSPPADFDYLDISVDNDFTFIDNDGTLTADIHEILHAGSDAFNSASSSSDDSTLVADDYPDNTAYDNAALEDTSEDDGNSPEHDGKSQEDDGKSPEDDGNSPENDETDPDSEATKTTPVRRGQDKDKETLSSVLKEVHSRLDGNRIAVPTNAAIKNKRPPKNRPIPQGKEKRRGTPNKHLDNDKQNAWFDEFKQYLDEDEVDLAEHGMEEKPGTAPLSSVVDQQPKQRADNRHLLGCPMDEYRKTDDNEDEARLQNSTKKRMHRPKKYGKSSAVGAGDAEILY